MRVGFYVSIRREGRGYRLLAGPYRTHEESLANVAEYRMRAINYDAKTAFDFFGTCRITQEKPLPFGIFTPEQNLFNWAVDT